MRQLVLASALGLAALAAHAADQVRSVGAFNAVSNSGPISVTIDVGPAQSMTASGSQEFLDALVTEVVDGELRIRLKDKHLSNIKGDPKLVITMPQLTRYDMSGAGATTISHASGEALEVHMSGAGSLAASGDVKRLTLVLSGVGSVEARKLRAETVDARVSGVGSVKVFASSKLDAAVSGVGGGE
jgi:hypothetical protein